MASRLCLRVLRSGGLRSRRPHATLTTVRRSLYPTCSSRLLAPAPPSFASTHAFRSWDPASTAEATQAPAAERGSATSSASKDTQTAQGVSPSSQESLSETAAVAAAHPYSTRAYRTRLLHGNYVSLRELTRAAYAPAPLQVLNDLLRLAVPDPSATAAWPHGSVLPSCRGAHHALERALDVQWVLDAAVAEARDTVLAAETLGDAASHTAAQELVSQLEMLANAVEDAARGVATQPCCSSLSPPELSPLPSPLLLQQQQHLESGDADDCSDVPAVMDVSKGEVSRWVLPAAAHATLLRGILQMSAIAGACLHAVSALEELIVLDERQQRARTRPSEEEATQEQHKQQEEEEVEDSFSMDDAVVLVDAAAQHRVRPLSAQDHLWAMQACATEHHRDFRTALSLYHRFVQHVTAGRFPATPADFTAALVALARSSRTTVEFTELRALLVASEAAAAVPVSVPLYTALIDAASRAVEEPQRMRIALSLYRRLRDGALTPTAETYAALIACCASTREPTHAFAFYHEARQVCGVASFTARVYTNLLLAYTAAGYGADARKTLDVLVEAGAPLSRASFHAALASAVTVREAQEMLHLMTERYQIAPTPHTYAYVVQALARAPAGATTALQLFDVHEEAMRALASLAGGSEMNSGSGQQAQSSGHNATSGGGSGGGVAVSSSAEGVALEPMLLQQFPLYVRALEAALMRLRVDTSQDPRLHRYLTPLVRVAQQRMNAFTGMPPQSPIRIPDKEQLCIAVLAADVLANLDEWVVPFMAHYSVLVIPYSALVSLQKGGGRRVDGVMPKGAAAGLYDPVWQDISNNSSSGSGSERDALVEHRRRRLQRFLRDHRDAVHLVSLDEELRWSRETRRYGVGITDLFARAAAVALHLARTPPPSAAGTGEAASVYAQHPNASLVLVSTDYNRCGKYVVALKSMRESGGSAGLRAALRRVSYHNPRTNPNWVPPTLSIARQQREASRGRGEEGGQDEGEETERRRGTRTVVEKEEDAQKMRHRERSAVSADAAYDLYKNLVHSAESEREVVDEEETRLGKASARSCDDESDEKRSAAAAHRQSLPFGVSVTADEKDEDAMDAALLMSLLNDEAQRPQS